jgi:hypothetical protein
MQPDAHSRTLPATPPFSRRAWPVAAMGALGLLSLLLKPVPVALLGAAPELAALPPLAQRAALLASPLVLLLLATLVGAAVAHRVHLGSVLAGTAAPGHLLRSLVWAGVLGLGAGIVLAATDAAFAPHLGHAWQEIATAATWHADELAIGMLYGGVAEEVMLRWGAMSLVAWALVSTFGQRRHERSMAAAIVIAAALFGAAHLPALAAQVELTPGIVARTMLINGMAGALYGWLFWRRNLEAAMACHAATHVGLATWRVLST